jgi:hypothetical protein
MASDPALVRRFFAQARATYLEGSGIGIEGDQVIVIASDTLLRFEFLRIWNSEINDPDFKRLIEIFLLDLADTLEDEARGSDRKVDLVDRGGFTVAAGVTVVGIGATIAAVGKGAAAGSVLGPGGALVGGLVGLAAVALGRNSLKKRSDGRRFLAEKVRRLIGDK